MRLDSDPAAGEARGREPEWEKEMAEWRELVVEALAGVTGRTERIVRAVGEFGLVEAPDLDRLSAESRSDREIIDWFLEAVPGPPTHPNVRTRTKGIFGQKVVRDPGWVFVEGSKEVGGRRPGGKAVYRDISVLLDGRVRYKVYDHTLPGYGKFEPPYGDHFNAKALKEIAALVRLRPLDLPPRPAHPGPAIVFPPS